MRRLARFPAITAAHAPAARASSRTASVRRAGEKSLPTYRELSELPLRPGAQEATPSTDSPDAPVQLTPTQQPFGRARFFNLPPHQTPRQTAEMHAPVLNLSVQQKYLHYINTLQPKIATDIVSNMSNRSYRAGPLPAPADARPEPVEGGLTFR